VEQIGGSNNAGFSLIELTVVVAILSVLSVSVSLALRERPTTTDATRFARAYELAKSQAIHSGARHGLSMTRTTFSSGTFRDGAWQSAAQAQSFDGTATLRLASAPDPEGPTLVFLPTGQTTAFELDLTATQNRQTCRTDGWAPLTCVAR
jgi:type II secretion system protein H